MSGSLPLGGPLAGAGFPALSRVSPSAVLHPSGPLPEPKPDPVAPQGPPAALQGAVQSAGPRMVMFKRLDWSRDLRADALNTREAGRLIRQAQAGRLPPLPSGELGLVRYAGRRAKADTSFLGLFTIRRDTRYKAVLSSGEALKTLYAQKPAADPDGRRAQLADIRGALERFEHSINEYGRRASLVRRGLMQELSVRVQLERTMIGRVDQSIEAGGGAIGEHALAVDLGELLRFARVGVDLETAGEALDQGISVDLLAQAAQTPRTDGRLPLPTLALLVRYPEAHLSDAIEDLAKLTRKGFTTDEIDNGLALGLPLDMLTTLSDQDRNSLSDRRAYLQAMLEVDHPGRAAHEIQEDERASLNSDARAFFDRKIPLELVGPCRRAGYDAEQAKKLVRVAIGAEPIELAARTGLSADDLRKAHSKNLPLEEFAWIRRSEPSISRAVASVRQLPDDTVLGWLRAEPATGRKLLRAEAAALQKAGAEDRGLPLADLVALMDAGVSIETAARLSLSPPDPATLAAFVALDNSPHAAFTRTEALLLAGAGWPASATTAATFRSTYPNGKAILPVTENTVKRDLARGVQVANAQALGSGAFNTVYAVDFRNAAGTVQQGVFKPLQTADTERIPMAAEQIGINLNAPRYELRNLAHAQIDRLLGFGVVPRCEIAVVEGVPGLLMERVAGMTARRERQWNPPADITQTPIGQQCLQFRNRAYRDEFAALKGIEIDIVKTRQGSRVMLYKGDYVAPLEPSRGDWQRSLIGLQWLHAVTGAADSHDENIMRAPDGSRFVGIDSDMSFGLRTWHPDQLIQSDRDPATRAFHGRGLPPIVDRDQYRALMKLDAQSLRQTIGDLIQPEEFKSTLDRLDAVKSHLKTLDKAGRVIEAHQWGDASYAVLAQRKGESYAERLLSKRERMPI